MSSLESASSEDEVFDEYVGAADDGITDDVGDDIGAAEDEQESGDSESEIDVDEILSELDITTTSPFIKEIVVVDTENRQTSDVMSKFEMTECVSIRAVQIARFNNCMVDITGLTDPVLMAKRELMMRKVPLTLRRYVGETENSKGEFESYYEYWNPNEMIFSTSYNDVL
jgi:DNA-directed RNA polymerase I, II, and III subunit RPABC2